MATKFVGILPLTVDHEFDEPLLKEISADVAEAEAVASEEP